MKFLDAVGPIAKSLTVWPQLFAENEWGRSGKSSKMCHSIQMPENEDLCFKVMVSFQFVQNHPYVKK